MDLVTVFKLHPVRSHIFLFVSTKQILATYDPANSLPSSSVIWNVTSHRQLPMPVYYYCININYPTGLF